MIGLWVACATSGAPEPVPLPVAVPVEEAYVLLHVSQPVFQAPDPEAPRGRLGVARQVDFPAELWPARVVAEQPGWLQVRPVPAGQSAAHWAEPPPVLQALGLSLWVPDTSPGLVVTDTVLQSWLDGSTVALQPGTPLSGSTALVRAGGATLRVTASPALDERGFRYVPHAMAPARRPVGWLGVDAALGFGQVGGVPLARVPRAGRSQPETRVPLEQQANDGLHHWGILGSRTARVRTVLDASLVRDSPGWSHAVTRPGLAPSYDGWWVVDPGAAVTWPDGTLAGSVSHTLRFDVAPDAEGERSCVWWQDLVGVHEPSGVTARWSTHASVLANTGLRLCLPASAVTHEPAERD